MDNLKLLKNKKILIVSAHPDDEVLGCGGTIFKLKKKNKIKVIFLTNGVSARSKNKNNILRRKKECLNLFNYLKIEKPSFLNFPDNKLDQIPLLKVIKKIEKESKRFKPDIVFTHYENCLNIDHQIAYKATITAFRPKINNSVKSIFSYEILSSTDWAVSQKKIFQPNYYINISNFIDKKIRAIKFYKSELRPYPHSRSVKAIKALAQVRGTSSGFKFAEGFVLVRDLNE